MKSEKFKATQQEMVKDLERFHSLSSRRLEFSQLSWNNFVARFLDQISFDIQIRSKSSDAVSDFSRAFSRIFLFIAKLTEEVLQIQLKQTSI